MRAGATAPVHGNAECIDFLEACLEHARKGQVDHVTVTMCQGDNEFLCEAVGTIAKELLCDQAIESLQAKRKAKFANRALPEPDPNLDASYVSYPVSIAPISWDCLIWLIDAEMTRRREGAPAPLKVGWWFGQDENCGLENEYRRTMFHGVVRPLLQMIGAVEDARAVRGRHKKLYVTRDIVAAYRAGESVPIFTMPGAMVSDGPAPVTITLRESSHWPHRNNDMVAWMQLARQLIDEGERVIFVRDTAKADDPLLGFETCPDASKYIDSRLALYQAAKANLFVSNGPGGLAIFGNRPYLYFLNISPDDPHYPNRPGFWGKFNGVEEGGQWPWALPTQRMVWLPDTYENLSAAWADLRGML